MVRVKICGITNLADAQHAVASGADALGFVFAKSPRQVKPADVAHIVRRLGPWVTTVGVFVNEPIRSILEIADQCSLSAVQLHGDEKPEMLEGLKGVRTIKAFRVGADFCAADARRYGVDAFLFDAKVEGRYGGTGHSFEWKLLRDARFGRPVIISGGLDASNVAKVVRMLSPYGVEASSGVESKPGKKNPKLVERFIRNAKKAR